MSTIAEKFAKLGVENAPGQEGLRKNGTLDLREEIAPGSPLISPTEMWMRSRPCRGALRLSKKDIMWAESRLTPSTAGKNPSGRIWRRS